MTIGEALIALRDPRLSPETKAQIIEALKKARVPGVGEVAAAPGAAPAAAGPSAPAMDPTWAKEFADRHGGRAPNAQDAWDRAYSLRVPGTGGNGTWTDADWRRTYRDRQEEFMRSGGRPSPAAVLDGAAPAPVATAASAADLFADLMTSRAGQSRDMSFLPTGDQNANLDIRAGMSRGMPGAAGTDTDEYFERFVDASIPAEYRREHARMTRLGRGHPETEGFFNASGEAQTHAEVMHDNAGSWLGSPQDHAPQEQQPAPAPQDNFEAAMASVGLDLHNPGVS